MNSITAIERNGDEPLREQVLHRCRRLLMSGQFLPGQRLPLRPLAEEFNTSLMPVRDALNTLVADGALEITSGRTIRVPELSGARVVELHEIRSSLEGLAAGFAAMKLSVKSIDRCEQLIGEMSGAFDRKDYRAYIDAHYSFHFTVYGGSDRPVLLGLIETLWLQLGPSFRQGIEKARRTYEADQNKGDPNHHHRRVIAALRTRDARATREAIEHDIMTGIEVYTSGIWPTETSKF